MQSIISSIVQGSYTRATRQQQIEDSYLAFPCWPQQRGKAVVVSKTKSKDQSIYL